MNLKDILKEALKTECMTPGVKYHTDISKNNIKIVLDLPEDLKLNNEEAKLLEKNIHNALEIVLAKYYIK